MGPPLREAEFNIYFESGIDDYGGWLQVLKDYDLVKQGGSWYTYTDDETGKEIKFLSKDFEKLVLSDTIIKKQIYNKICETLIMAYKTDDIGIDDIQIGNDDVPQQNNNAMRGGMIVDTYIKCENIILEIRSLDDYL